jgi:hypothetical protein
MCKGKFGWQKTTSIQTMQGNSFQAFGSSKRHGIVNRYVVTHGHQM